MAYTYYTQVGKYLHMMDTHRIVTVHGFTLNEINSVRDKILAIESVIQINSKNQTERRGMHNILVSKDVTQDEFSIIDKVCARMNCQLPCNFTNPSDHYRRSTNMDNFTQASVSIIVESNNNLDPNAWETPLFPKNQNKSNSLAFTHATVLMDEAATQQLLDDNSKLREEN